jgi:flavin reductase (DIM6/NTAB) family NADH-FMN oxidoreductase RutF
MIIDPGTQQPRDIYRLMNSVVLPRPIAFVSTLSAGGVRNLAPFSYFTAVCANPPVIAFAPMNRGRDGALKDTLQNIVATREFVVNIVSESLAGQMNQCSADFPPEIDEFEVSGLTPVASDLVRPPRVGECLASMECRLLQVVQVSPKPLGGNLVLGEVLRFHLRDGIVQDFHVDPSTLHAIGRMGGATYTRTSDRFDLPRPILPTRS